MELRPEAPSQHDDYVMERDSSALVRPVVEDVRDKIADLLPAFTDGALRDSYRGDTVDVILGALRERELFPRSNRFNTSGLVAWEKRSKVTMDARDALEVICDPAFAKLRPYTVLPVSAFGGPLRDVIKDVNLRARIDPYGFALLWIGGGGYVTPLHHDGELVHARWHLVVRGEKQFDFLPPACRRVPRLPRTNLYRRFSPLYTSGIPDAWLTDGTGAHRARLTPGHMVTWGRRWWHRVQVAESGVTVALSTRGMRSDERSSPRAIAQRVTSKLLGEAEEFLEEVEAAPTLVDLDDLRRQLP
jgi:hypothetical protein